MQFDIKKFICGVMTATMLIGFTSLSAEWDPEMSLVDATVDFSVLQDSGYLKLKRQVIDTLKGSWCSQEKINLLMDIVMLEKPKVCVEIGAFTGSSVLPVAATLAYLSEGKVYAIDGWSNKIAIRNMAENDANKQWWSKVDMNSVKKGFESLMSSQGVKKYVQMIQLSSEDAVTKFESIDFIHFDGDYSEKGALIDVELYIPKVKQGGYVLLSNIFTMVNGVAPKVKAFCALSDTCELIGEIENDNAILFRKR